jgi:carbon-monoxide dehydrogenase medium subunit
MKPAEFRYARPETLESVLRLLAEEPKSRILAGGQSLITLLNLRLARPEVLIDLGGLKNLRYVVVEEGKTSLGAMVTYRDLLENGAVTARHPVLEEMVSFIGHPSIRNRGTLGGAVAQADPGAEFPAAMVLLRAEICVDSLARGRRIIPAEEFFVGHYVSVLESDELIAEIVIPDQINFRNWGFKEFSLRHRDYPLAGACVLVQTDVLGTLTHVRAVLINAGETPILLDRTDELPSATSAVSIWEDWAQDVAKDLTPEAHDVVYSRDIVAQALVIAARQACNRALLDTKETNE